jgi:hypothetical protein
MTIPQYNTNLTGRCAFLRKFADVVNDLLGSGLEPLRRGAGLGNRGGGDAFAVAVHASHLDGLGW